MLNCCVSVYGSDVEECFLGIKRASFKTWQFFCSLTMFVSVPLSNDAFKPGHLPVIRAYCADVSANLLFPCKTIWLGLKNRIQTFAHPLAYLCLFWWGRQFAQCPTFSNKNGCQHLILTGINDDDDQSEDICLHLKPLVDFFAIGGEELLEIAFFRFSFFRRRVPPIESSLKVRWLNSFWLINCLKTTSTIHSRREMTSIDKLLQCYSVSPERHVAVRIEDAVEPRPTRDGGGWWWL